MLKLYNSLTNKKEKIKTIESNKVRMYVCGITPYDTTHLGHAFTYVHFDLLRRFLTYSGFEVIYTQNVTDIDDDILRKSKEEKRDWTELGATWTEWFLEDMKSLNIPLPTHYVKATDSIPTIIRIIEKLLKAGFAYQSGNIYFDVTKFKRYGALSKLTTEQMILYSKERGADPDDPKKNNPLDFILWQKSKKDEPSWNAPFGDGRPGWHIECSAMNLDTLGEQIDIHGGGKDLIFPHHESEIAQSESYTSKSPFSKFWMHTAMVEYCGEKMAKSLGNLVMVKNLLKTYSPNAIRFLLLSHHYRRPWEYQHAQIVHAQKIIDRIEETLNDGSIEPIIEALSDDLNTPKALQLLINKPDHKAFELLGFTK